MKSSAVRTCFGSSRTTRRTNTFVSTARMPLANVLPDSVLHIERSLLCVSLGEEHAVNVFRCVPPRPANHDLIILLIPFEYGAGSHSELLANLSRHGDLTLSGQFGL